MKSNVMRTTLFLLSLVFLVSTPAYTATERGVEIRSKNELSHQSGKLGTYRALVIGINNYQDKKIPALKTAVNDAREFANLLQTRYGFQITLLLDRQATRKEIIEKLRDLAADSSNDESVLIYYAGHGEIDRILNDGWWVPADAKGGDSSTYLDNTLVQKVMKGMKARHVLLVSDSCYSGTLFGESRSLPPLIDDRFYLNLYNEKSRWGMTSGNKTPVSDSGSKGHSIFAYQLIRALTKNERPYITTQEIYNQIAPIIANNSEQRPRCSPVQDTGDEGGGFVFVASRTPSVPYSVAPSYLNQSAPQPESDELIRQREDLERERQELARQKEELDRQKALDAEREQLAAERRKFEAERQQLAMGPRPTVTGPREIGRDGRFIAYDDGTVLDTKTKLMWAAKDNGSNINWQNAKSYCENYRGGGYTDWRMPTREELAGLYDRAIGYTPLCARSGDKDKVHLTDLINMSCWWAWASETISSFAAAYFNFDVGWRDSDDRALSNRYRALPVRSGK